MAVPPLWRMIISRLLPIFLIFSPAIAPSFLQASVCFLRALSRPSRLASAKAWTFQLGIGTGPSLKISNSGGAHSLQLLVFRLGQGDTRNGLLMQSLVYRIAGVASVAGYAYCCEAGTTLSRSQTISAQPAQSHRRPTL